MNQNKNTVFLVALIAALVTGLFAATNYCDDGQTIALTFANVSPSAGDAVVKGTDKAHGALVGVALTGTATVGETVVVATEGVFKVPVVSGAGIAVGDYVFTTIDGIGTSTCALTNTNTGILFGQALEAIAATSTAHVIPVLLRQPNHL